MTKPLSSAKVNTSNILLKFSVPKRTGRRRKRGSTEPYQDVEDSATATVEEEQPKRVDSTEDARRLTRTLRDNKERYTVEPIGTIDRTHRFRGKTSIYQFSYLDLTESRVSRLCCIYIGYATCAEDEGPYSPV